MKLFNFKSIHRSQESRCQQLLQKKKIVEDLRTNIKRKKENIQLLHRLLDERNGNLTKSIKQKDTVLKQYKDTKKKLPQYEKNVNNLRDFVEKRLETNGVSNQMYEQLKHQLKYRVRHNLQMLIKYIFPITQTVSKVAIPPDFIAPDTESALAEATHTAYVRGRWILQDSQNELQHIIVAPSLPNSGDYSAYNDWVATTKDGVPASSSSGTNDSLSSSNSAYRISAALTYTTQLLHLLSFYLDVRLPYKIFYSDFCKKELSEQSFIRKVARLNANILYLCYTQRVKLSQLYPNHTLENVKQLLNTDVTDLGRIGAVELSDGLVGASDSQLVQDLNTGNDSESDGKLPNVFKLLFCKNKRFVFRYNLLDENSFPTEWEAIPHVSVLDMSAPTQHQISQQQQASSMAGGLVNNAVASVTSVIWRVWTTGR